MQLKPIIQAKINNFRKNFQFAHKTEDELFEFFVNYSILTFYQSDAFTADFDLLESVCVGGSTDTGIDGIGILVNGILIEKTETIDEIVQRNRNIEIEFIFIQSKNKNSFEANEFLKFYSGVVDFLSETPKFPHNKKIENFVKIKEYLFQENIVAKWENNPKVRLYFVSLGKYHYDPIIEAYINKAKEEISNLFSYDDAYIELVSDDKLKLFCDSNESKFESIIAVNDFMELSQVNGVENSMIAICSAKEFLKLIIMPENNEIRKSLFEDNIRDFQGENSINNEISETIVHNPSQFILMNNGINVVCSGFKTNNKKISIKNPRIVNGCQTSHVLFYCYKKGISISDVSINLKLISTENSEITNLIVRGTNRQNQVLEEVFESIKPFHKDLGDFFESYSTNQIKLYYERRSKQYSNNPNIDKTQIINLRILVQSFMATFLDKPYESHKHEARLLKEFRSDLFNEKHSFLPYLTSSICFYILESIFRENYLPQDMRPYKMHLLNMYIHSFTDTIPSLYNQKKIDDLCETILKETRENNITKFIDLSKIFNDTKNVWVNERNRSKDGIKDIKEFYELLRSQTNNHYFNMPLITVDEEFAKPKCEGIVLLTKIDKNGFWYGFIKSVPEFQKENIFFHSSSNSDIDFQNLRGKKVSFTISIDKKQNLVAKDMQII